MMRPTSSVLPKTRSQTLITLGLCLLLAAGTLAVYWPVTHFDFVGMDDPFYVTQNPYTQRGLTWAGLAWAFTNIEAEFWHPWTWWSHMLDYQIYGPQAGGHHLTSLIFHI